VTDLICDHIASVGNYIVNFTSFFLTPRIATPYEIL
jgi:hypothetical protein